MDALRTAREDVEAATHSREARNRESDAVARSGASSSGVGGVSSGRVKGPTLPSSSDLTLAREMDAERRDQERTYQRKRDRLEAKERVEDMVGPKPVGREGMLEKKRAQRENDRAFRERGDDGFEADESTLMGGGDGFKEQLRIERSLLFPLLSLVRAPSQFPFSHSYSWTSLY